MGDAQAVLDELEDWTDEILEREHERWDGGKELDPFEYGPIPWFADEPPETVAAQREEFAGMASVVTFHTDERRETVLVYQRQGFWAPPGGAIDRGNGPADIARIEAREETGLEVELDNLLFTRRVTYKYESGHSVELPAVTYVGHRTGGEVRPERLVNDHPYACRAVGLFDKDVLPEECRDREHILPVFEHEPEDVPTRD